MSLPYILFYSIHSLVRLEEQVHGFDAREVMTGDIPRHMTGRYPICAASCSLFKSSSSFINHCPADTFSSKQRRIPM